MHLGLRVPPVGGDRHRLARLGDRQRADEFGGQHGRLPDLSRDQHVLGLERERRPVRLQLGAGIGAAHFDAEGKAADRLRRAGVDAAGLRLARLPAVDGAFGNAGAVVPGAGP